MLNMDDQSTNREIGNIDLSFHSQKNNVQKNNLIINFIGVIIILSGVSLAAHASQNAKYTTNTTEPVSADTASTNDTGVTKGSATSLQSTTNPQIIAEQSNTQPDILTQINTLRKNNDLASAKTVAIEFLKTHPDNIDVMLLLGLIYYQTSQYDQAEYFLKKVIDKSPTYLDAELGLIRVKIAKKQYQEASNLLNQVIKQAPDNADVKQIQAFYQKAIKAQITTHPVPQKTITSKPPILEKIRTLIKKKELNSAESLAIQYLKNQPEDPDVMLFLGLIYYQKSQYGKAELYFHKVLQKVPTYLDAKLGLIRVKITQKKYKEASNLIRQVVKQAPDNADVKQIQILYKKSIIAKIEAAKKEKETKKNKYELSLIDQYIENGEFYRALVMINALQCIHPCDPDLIAARAKILLKMHLYGRSACFSKKALAIDPANAAAKDILSTINEVDPHTLYGLNEIGISSLNERVSDLNATWDYSTLYYSRETPAGLLYARMNYARRLGNKGKQGEIEFSPVFNQFFYLDLYANFSKKPELFPQYAGAIEGYLSIPNLPTVSLGPYFAHIKGSKFYRKYTASLSKDLSKYWLSIRVNHYVPNRGTLSTLYIGNIRRYFITNDCYLNLGFGYGTSPDLADLQTVDFIFIRNRFVNLGLRFPIFDNRTLIDVGVDYQHWKYPTGLVRELYGLNIGFNYRF